MIQSHDFLVPKLLGSKSFKGRTPIPGDSHGFHGSTLEMRQGTVQAGTRGLLVRADRRLPSSNPMFRITSSQALYKPSKIIQVALVNYSPERMGWCLGIVMIAQRETGFQGTFSQFSAVGGVAAIPLFFVVAGCSLAFHLPQGSGRACG